MMRITCDILGRVYFQVCNLWQWQRHSQLAGGETSPEGCYLQWSGKSDFPPFCPPPPPPPHTHCIPYSYTHTTHIHAYNNNSNAYTHTHTHTHTHTQDRVAYHCLLSIWLDQYTDKHLGVRGLEVPIIITYSSIDSVNLGIYSRLCSNIGMISVTGYLFQFWNLYPMLKWAYKHVQDDSESACVADVRLKRLAFCCLLIFGTHRELYEFLLFKSWFVICL